MKSYRDWRTDVLLEDDKKPDEKEKKPRVRGLKRDGGVTVDKQVAQRVDLIVLPPEIEGTNCGNCEYFEKSGDMGWCKHDKIKQWVTARMCCSLWDNDKVKRSWGKQSISS